MFRDRSGTSDVYRGRVVLYVSEERRAASTQVDDGVATNNSAIPRAFSAASWRGRDDAADPA